VKFLVFALPIALFFESEISHFLMSLTFIQWLAIISIFSLSSFFLKRKIKVLMISSIRKIKNFSSKKYKKKLSNWSKEVDAKSMGKSFAFWLERNVFVKLGCIVLSMAIFRHYPILLTELRPATILLLTFMAYSFVSLAFRREMLIFMVVLYTLMAFMPYAMAILGYLSGKNPFETLPTDIIYSQHINISNLTQTANHLFLSIAPWISLMILFLLMSSVFLRFSLNLVFTGFLNVVRLIIN
jgi:hypothetical protein